MLFLENDRKRRAFRLGQQSGLRSTDATVEQLQQQRAFDCAEYERQIAVLHRDLVRAEYERVRAEYERARAEAALALMLTRSPSDMEH